MSTGSNRAAIDETRAAAQSALEQIERIGQSAESERNAAINSRAEIERILGEARSLLGQVQPIVAQITAAQSQVVSDQAVIATKSEHIQNAQTHADSVRSNLDKIFTTCKQHQTEAEVARTAALNSSERATQLVAEITAAEAAAKRDIAEVRAAQAQADDSAARTKGLADKAEQIEAKVAEYEKRLAGFEAKCQEQLKAIEALLPGATSAGLAHAFDERRKTFLKPATRWQWLFVGSVSLLVVLAATGLWHVYTVQDSLTYDALLRLWLARLPIAGALIWLALYASRESALAKRLEEDYGYKAAVAASFQGFFKQMSEAAAGTGESVAPSIKLCADTLATIATPPGRIYDKHALTVTPSGEIASTAKAMVETARA
ncbi:hypothetical protein [Steroidobacter agaridevorans]|uniref:hypothetical protein n=1 Tax=Steroidobacter agaridevorans TaxID=2695856 RepID=UPI00137A5041|nr:hypothetical protein [Steroidobacter agaridevorans]